MAKVSHAGPAKDLPPTPVYRDGRPVLVLTRPFGLPPGTDAALRLYMGRHRRKPASQPEQVARAS